MIIIAFFQGLVNVPTFKSPFFENQISFFINKKSEKFEKKIELPKKK